MKKSLFFLLFITQGLVADIAKDLPITKQVMQETPDWIWYTKIGCIADTEKTAIPLMNFGTGIRYESGYLGCDIGVSAAYWPTSRKSTLRLIAPKVQLYYLTSPEENSSFYYGMGGSFQQYVRTAFGHFKPNPLVKLNEKYGTQHSHFAVKSAYTTANIFSANAFVGWSILRNKKSRQYFQIEFGKPISTYNEGNAHADPIEELVVLAPLELTDTCNKPTTTVSQVVYHERIEYPDITDHSLTDFIYKHATLELSFYVGF